MKNFYVVHVHIHVQHTHVHVHIHVQVQYIRNWPINKVHYYQFLSCWSLPVLFMFNYHQRAESHSVVCYCYHGNRLISLLGVSCDKEGVPSIDTQTTFIRILQVTTTTIIIIIIIIIIITIMYVTLLLKLVLHVFFSSPSSSHSLSYS